MPKTNGVSLFKFSGIIAPVINCISGINTNVISIHKAVINMRSILSQNRNDSENFLGVLELDFERIAKSVKNRNAIPALIKMKLYTATCAGVFGKKIWYNSESIFIAIAVGLNNIVRTAESHLLPVAQ